MDYSRITHEKEVDIKRTQSMLGSTWGVIGRLGNELLQFEFYELFLLNKSISNDETDE